MMPIREMTDEDREAVLNWITIQTQNAANEVLHKFRNYAVIGFLILLIGIGAATWWTNRNAYESRGVICKIIKQGDYQAYQYEKEGTITNAQLRRALTASQEYRKLLLPAQGCDTDYTKPHQRQVGPSTSIAPRNR